MLADACILALRDNVTCNVSWTPYGPRMVACPVLGFVRTAALVTASCPTASLRSLCFRDFHNVFCAHHSPCRLGRTARRYHSNSWGSWFAYHIVLEAHPGSPHDISRALHRSEISNRHARRVPLPSAVCVAGAGSPPNPFSVPALRAKASAAAGGCAGTR